MDPGESRTAEAERKTHFGIWFSILYRFSCSSAKKSDHRLKPNDLNGSDFEIKSAKILLKERSVAAQSELFANKIRSNPNKTMPMEKKNKKKKDELNLCVVLTRK